MFLPVHTQNQMTARIIIEPRHEAESQDIAHLVHTAIEGEIKRLEAAIMLAETRLAPFEKQYSVSSAIFLETFAAEDLSGGDDEYVEWSGEYRLMLRLIQSLEQLRGLEYATP